LSNGDYVKAEERFDMAIAAIRPYSASDRRLLARSYCDLARVLYHQERYAQAEPLAKWALSVRDADKKANPDVVFQSVYVLALIHTAQHHLSEAEPLLKRALELQEKALGPDHINVALTLDQLASVHVERGNYTAAEPRYRRALAIQERKTPDENLDLAETADHFAILLRRINRNVEAQKWEARARTIRDTVAAKAAAAKAKQFEKKFQGFK
jgi:tetratricopeptide (TPR) repeat protein